MLASVGHAQSPVCSRGEKHTLCVKQPLWPLRLPQPPSGGCKPRPARLRYIVKASVRSVCKRRRRSGSNPTFALTSARCTVLPGSAAGQYFLMVRQSVDGSSHVSKPQLLASVVATATAAARLHQRSTVLECPDATLAVVLTEHTLANKVCRHPLEASHAGVRHSFRPCSQWSFWSLKCRVPADTWGLFCCWAVVHVRSMLMSAWLAAGLRCLFFH